MQLVHKPSPGTHGQTAENHKTKQNVNIVEPNINVGNVEHVENSVSQAPPPVASLMTLPTEILIEIVSYLRPLNPKEPITGVNAAWVYLGEFRSSLTRPPIPRRRKLQKKREKRAHDDSALRALRLTCSIFKEICAPIVYEAINILFDGNHYTTAIIPNASHVRTIRIMPGFITDEEVANIVASCRNATSIALYSDELILDSSWELQMEKTNAAIVALFEEGKLDTIGLYSLDALEGGYERYPKDGISPFLLSILDNPKAKAALKRLEITSCFLHNDMWRRIRTELFSLETLTIASALDIDADEPCDDIWIPGKKDHWATYSNLTRLQLAEYTKVYSDQISHLVRNFPSLKHLVVASCGEEDLQRKSVAIPLPKGWYKQEDALWKVRSPLETLHLEHMLGWEIRFLVDIPTKALIVTNLRGDFIVENFTEDPNTFPGLKAIHIQPAIIPEYTSNSLRIHPFDATNLAKLEQVCSQRQLSLVRNAVAITLFPKHYC